MRAVIQRVDRASVSVRHQPIAAIDRGICVFLGIERDDQEKDLVFLADKVIQLRIFEDTDGKMNRSLLDMEGELLVVSQFTLLADCRKGRRPSFTAAEDPEKARGWCDAFVELARRKVRRVVTGEFQAMMKVELVNNGPVTLILDSRTA